MRRARLPSEKDRKAAEKEAGALAAELTQAWAEGGGLTARLEDLVARFGLDVARPAEPTTPGPKDAKVAYLVGLLLAQTALGEPDDVVVPDLGGVPSQQQPWRAAGDRSRRPRVRNAAGHPPIAAAC